MMWAKLSTLRRYGEGRDEHFETPFGANPILFRIFFFGIGNVIQGIF
jgi:hypothetical protein